LESKYSWSFLLSKILALTVLVFAVLVNFDLLQVSFLGNLLIILQIILVFEYKKFKPFALFLVFSIPYTLVAVIHFMDSSFPLHLGGHIDFDSDRFYIKTFVIISLFWSSLTLVLPEVKNSLVIREFLVFRYNNLVFYTLLSIELFIVIFGRSGDGILQSSGYGSVDSNTTNLGGTAIFEYFIVLYPIAYIFSGDNRFRVTLLISLALIYTSKAILLGGRVETLQCLLMFFLLHFDNHRISLFKLLTWSIPVISFFILFAFVRSSPDLNIFEIVSVIKENYQFAGYTFFGNQIDVFYSSTRLYGFVDFNILTTVDRIEIFLLNLLAVVVPYGYLPEKANLAAYLQDTYSAGGGGILPIFFYVYSSFFGVLFIGLILGTLIRKAIKMTYYTSSYWFVYIVLLFSTFPRWYAYSSNVLYKFCFYSVIVLWLINIFILTIRKFRL
jgi:hypothetical protein